MNTSSITLEEIMAIANKVGTTWKVKRALLRLKNVPEDLIKILVKENNPSDY